MLQIRAQPYVSKETILYQRTTVIISDFVFYYAAYRWIQELVNNRQFVSRSRKSTIYSSTVAIYTTLFTFNVAHLLVDNIHFQYNGLLNGLLLLSMLSMIQKCIYWSSFWFAVLLNLKHIYLYMAPAYFVFLMTNYCIVNREIQFKTLFKLALVVGSVFAISFSPFILHGQLFVVLGRLFPFHRGLSHAYWAPNLWACYNGLDILLSKLFKSSNRPNAFTSGLVQQSEHQVLPSISPRTSTFCVFFVLAVSLCVPIHQNFF